MRTCKGTCSSAANKYEYQGITDCRAAVALIGGPKSCSFGCLGLGTCVSVCAFGALSIVDGVAVVDEDKCVLWKMYRHLPKRINTKETS